MDEEDAKLEIAAYKIMAESAENSSGRRLESNNVYLAINGAVAGLDAFLVKEGHPKLLWITLFFGVLVCGLWIATLAYYRALATAKYKLLGEFEVEKGITGYQREWEVFAAETPFGRLGWSLSSIEMVIAVIALLGHVLALIVFGYVLPPPTPAH